ncbi:MAG: hypothetical protein Q9219_003405 [cf. Caloplaca sp. 3 TL-2023]
MAFDHDSGGHLARSPDPSSITNPMSKNWSQWFILVLILYPLCAAFLRHRRLRTTLKIFPYTTRQSFARMTDDDAFEIQINLAQLEFPFTFLKAMQFALFRTYGIPSISQLLVATSQFSDIATASKRYADTAVLIREFTSQKPTEPRTLEAIARMNYIHSLYQKTGAIRDDDMLFTLSLFALEPIRWIERYEWRELHDFEQCALGVFWKSIGDAMGISYQKLRSAQDGWSDGLHWLKDMAEWSERYEEANMLPHPKNMQTATETVAILLWGVPRWLKPFGERTVSALMDDRLRAAMMCDPYFSLDSCQVGGLTVDPGTKNPRNVISFSSLASSQSGNFFSAICSCHVRYFCGSTSWKSQAQMADALFVQWRDRLSM